ncbi:ankyrin repeat domain-containing protein [Rhodoferax ferrireducens]|uniref:ankyrin repeat domain-containing protein n=1 Tax=Rhodoferax ferrireducens TaxID=192843 RepID=UPI003BB7CD4D
MFNFKYVFYLIVLISYSFCHAGSYDDFFTAIKHNDTNTVIGLLNRGFDANTLDPAGEHGLLLAIREPSLEVATVLINWPKTKVETRNRQDESPLMLAAINGLTEICQQLINKGADVNKPGWTPLHYAATHGHLAVMNLLLENYAYIDAASPNGSTPLMMAASYGTPMAVKLLLEAGADPMLKNDQGLSAIDFAQRANRAESAEMISAFVRARQPKEKW